MRTSKQKNNYRSKSMVLNRNKSKKVSKRYKTQPAKHNKKSSKTNSKTNKKQKRGRHNKHKQSGGHLYGVDDFNSGTKVRPIPQSPFADIKCTIL
jgi:hypothetical protein